MNREISVNVISEPRSEFVKAHPVEIKVGTAPHKMSLSFNEALELKNKIEAILKGLA